MLSLHRESTDSVIYAQRNVNSEVRYLCIIEPLLQRLVGATLLVFANKQDLPGAMSADEIREVS